MSPDKVTEDRVPLRMYETQGMATEWRGNWRTSCLERWLNLDLMTFSASTLLAMVASMKSLWPIGEPSRTESLSGCLLTVCGWVHVYECLMRGSCRCGE